MGTLQVVSQKDGRTYSARRLFINGLQVYPPMDGANGLQFRADDSTEDVGEGQLLIAGAGFRTTLPPATTTLAATTTAQPTTTAASTTTTQPGTTTEGATTTGGPTTTGAGKWRCYHVSHYPTQDACYSGTPFLGYTWECFEPPYPPEGACVYDSDGEEWLVFEWTDYPHEYSAADECVRNCGSTTAPATTTLPGTTTPAATTTGGLAGSTTLAPGWYCVLTDQYHTDDCSGPPAATGVYVVWDGTAGYLPEIGVCSVYAAALDCQKGVVTAIVAGPFSGPIPCAANCPPTTTPPATTTPAASTTAPATTTNAASTTGAGTTTGAADTTSTTQPATTTAAATTTPEATTTAEPTTTGPATTTPPAPPTTAGAAGTTTSGALAWYCVRIQGYYTLDECEAQDPQRDSLVLFGCLHGVMTVGQTSDCEAGVEGFNYARTTVVSGPYASSALCIPDCHATTTAAATTTLPATTTPEPTTTAPPEWYCRIYNIYETQMDCQNREYALETMYVCEQSAEPLGDCEYSDALQGYVSFISQTGPYAGLDACNADCRTTTAAATTTEEATTTAARPENTCNDCEPPIPDTLTLTLTLPSVINGPGDYSWCVGVSTVDWNFNPNNHPVCGWPKPNSPSNFVWGGSPSLQVFFYEDGNWYISAIANLDAGQYVLFIKEDPDPTGCNPFGTYVLNFDPSGLNTGATATVS